MGMPTVPARPVDGDSQIAARSVTKHRVTALVGQIIDELENRKRSGRGDIVARACDEIALMPALDALALLRALLPESPTEQQGKTTKSLGLQALFVSAAREMAASGNGVQLGLVEAQVIDNTEIDW